MAEMTLEKQISRAQELLDAEDYAGAAAEGSRALRILPDLAEISIVRGHALLSPLLNIIQNGDGTAYVCRQDFKGAYEAFRLALVMDPSNAVAAMELERLNELLKRLPDFPPQQSVEVEEVDEPDAGPERPGPDFDSDTMFDVVIVGAGAAGIGCGFMLTNVFGVDPSRVLLFDRGEAVGTSFRMWPDEMRFISPSFNQQGWTNSFDLNSVAYGTSPAFTLHAQHPSGEQYADYLAELTEAARLNVKTRTEVLQVVEEGCIFNVHVRTSTADGIQGEEMVVQARYVVWAAGEFQYPRDRPCAVAGAELCTHNSRVRSWASLPGDDFVVIGGFESGADAAINLAKAGKRSTVLASTGTWNVQTPDPSTELSPYTAQRLHEVTAAGFPTRPKLLAPLRVVRVEKAAEGGFNVVATWKAAERVQLTKLRWKVRDAEVGDTAVSSTEAGAEGSQLVVHTAQPPVLATGFEGSVAAVARYLFDLSEEGTGCLAGAPLVTENDESKKVAGVFLVGPSLVHGEHSFCFIYKFRQRFGIVANAICRGLGRDTTRAVENCRKMNMYLDDLKCCEATCGQTC